MQNLNIILWKVFKKTHWTNRNQISKRKIHFRKTQMRRTVVDSEGSVRVENKGASRERERVLPQASSDARLWQAATTDNISVCWGLLPLNSPFATEKNACNKNTRSVYTKCAELVGLNELDLFPILFLE